MMFIRSHLVCGMVILLAVCSMSIAQDDVAQPKLDELKVSGARSSHYLTGNAPANSDASPEPDLDGFRREIGPLLESACVDCHGSDLQEGHIRIDTLNPDLFSGEDVSWWLEVLAVLANGEMPPTEAAELSDSDRAKLVQWLSLEIQSASTARRSKGEHSSFRRMTRYEYTYALQDLLGLPFDFGKDLPPDPSSEDGFLNSSETLHMSVTQFQTYRESALKALRRATVRGEQPAKIFWGVSMKDAADIVRKKQEVQLEEIREQHKDDPEKLQKAVDRKVAEFKARPKQTHYRDPDTGLFAKASWAYYGAKYAWEPSSNPVEVPAVSGQVAVIPKNQKLIVELGDTIPERGTLRVRVRATRGSADERPPSLRLEFGWQASNDSRASVQIGGEDLVIEALPGEPEWYQWEAPLSEIYPRNSVRNISQMGDLPSPSEFIRFINNSLSNNDAVIDYVEVTTPVYDQWPTKSHEHIFFDSQHKDERKYAREILSRFMARAWRCEVTESDVEQKIGLFEKVRPTCVDFEEAIVEVLSVVLSSPKFLYVGKSDLATRLSMFLWSSIPDQKLLEAVSDGKLADPDVLRSQVKRMLADPKSRRFAEQFTRQWLGMQLLDYLDVDRKKYPRFDQSLREAMQEEPIAFFLQLLQSNGSVLDLIHAKHTMANERLAKHYGLKGVYGKQFRQVSFDSDDQRGGLLTQAGLLAMNSDGKDSHPLKRGIWLLERILNDPPPPPPPAVPEIDLADPEIAKLTLKQRIEDHRNDAACMSCHAKIDPWGIAFENYDAVGKWRTEIQGKPVDATAELFNGQPIKGMEGLKRFLLSNRQDQFVRALVHKMTTYALGRPLTFGDRSVVDEITAGVRKDGDGLATMVEAIVTSELFDDSKKENAP